jgi:hypothetical protein
VERRLPDIGSASVRQYAAQAADGARRIECQFRPHRRARGFLPAKMRQGRGEKELRQRKIPIGLDRSTQPRHRGFVLAEIKLGKTAQHSPDMDVAVAR